MKLPEVTTIAVKRNRPTGKHSRLVGTAQCTCGGCPCPVLEPDAFLKWLDASPTQES